MNHTTYEILKDFAAPATAVVAAGIAAMFGFVQYRVARAQAATAASSLKASENKLALDLFDKRWVVVQGLQKAVAAIVTEGNVRDNTRFEFVDAMERAKLLFGDEVYQYLDRVLKAMGRHCLGRSYLNSHIEDRINQGAALQFESFEEISAFYTEFPPLIAPYMAMHNKVAK